MSQGNIVLLSLVVVGVIAGVFGLVQNWREKKVEIGSRTDMILERVSQVGYFISFCLIVGVCCAWASPEVSSLGVAAISYVTFAVVSASLALGRQD